MWFMDNYLMHYGTKFHSGRYPYGSGENPYQHDAMAFRARVSELRNEGLSDKEIAKYFGVTTTELRPMIAAAKDELRASKIEQASALKEKGLSYSEIGRRMGIPDTSVHSLLDEKAKARTYAAMGAAEFLKDQVDSKGLIDVGKNVCLELNISQQKMDEALWVLKNQGYKVYAGGKAQVTNPGQQTNTLVLCPPDTEYKQIYNDPVHSVTDYIFHEGEEKPRKAFEYPKSMDSKRLKIRYAEDGGIDKDGLIEIRPGVADLSLGDSKYAQVRILVDGTHYLKGMAAYSDNMPDGVDVVFNTNKTKDKPMEKVLKEIKEDPDNPFGAALMPRGGQSYYEDSDGKSHLSLINKTNEEGGWSQWSKQLPAQFLSKQPISLVNRQLNEALMEKEDEYKQILNLTQPNVKKSLLMEFASDCDGLSADLHAASLPGQSYKVILPVPSLKDTECYAPDLKNGERVALVRFPHGGTFEIPILTVNNKNKEARNMFGNAEDGIGINKHNADILSGADFDGDTVIRIPLSDKVQIKNQAPLKLLEGYDPKIEYPAIPGMKTYSHQYYQTEMGKATNLIADMTIRGASEDKIAHAVRYSMVVIDAEKHKLNIKEAFTKEGIPALKEEFQGRVNPKTGNYTESASTLITRAGAQQDVPKRKGQPYIDRETGELIYKDDPDRFYVSKKTGKVVERTQKSRQMLEVKDARELSSGTKVEEAYADYANSLKAMANNARLEATRVKSVQRSPSAANVYKKEVNELQEANRRANLNAPRERAAQRLASSTIEAKKAANPNMTKEELGKHSNLALQNARLAVGAKREKIHISDRQWEAIQAGACSSSFLDDFFTKIDKDELRVRATPRRTENATLSKPQISRIKQYANLGKTTSEIAEAMGISTSTVNKYLKEG